MQTETMKVEQLGVLSAGAAIPVSGDGAHSGRNEQTCWERRRRRGPVVQSFLDGGIAGCNPESGSNLLPALFRLGCWTECPVLGIGGAFKLRVLQTCARQTQDGRQSTDLSHVTLHQPVHILQVRRKRRVGGGGVDKGSNEAVGMTRRPGMCPLRVAWSTGEGRP